MSVIRDSQPCRQCSGSTGSLSLSVVPKPTAVGQLTPHVSQKLLNFAHKCQAQYLPGADAMQVINLDDGSAHANVPPNNFVHGLDTLEQGNMAIRATWLANKQANALCADIPLNHIRHSLATSQAVKVAVPGNNGSFHFTTNGRGITALQYQA